MKDPLTSRLGCATIQRSTGGLLRLPTKPPPHMPTIDFLEDVPELQPEAIKPRVPHDPAIGSQDPEPVPTDTFPTSDIY